MPEEQPVPDPLPEAPGPEPVPLALPAPDRREPPRPKRKMKPRATKEERAEIVAFVVKMLIQKATIWEVEKILRARYGFRPNSCNHYVQKARQELLKQTRKPRRLHIAEAFAFYESLIRDPAMPPQIRLMAQDRIVFMLGLRSQAKPRKAKSGQGGTLEIIETVVRTRQEAAAVIAMNNGQAPMQVIDGEVVEARSAAPPAPPPDPQPEPELVDYGYGPEPVRD